MRTPTRMVVMGQAWVPGLDEALGGSITAAQFIQRFIDKGMPWAHLDIAGMAWSSKDADTVPKGGTGYGVRLLDRLVRDHYER